jgi:hypothetical protein
MTMTPEKQRLAVELRFRIDASPSVWSNLLASLVSWEPRLRPTHVEKFSDLDSYGPEALKPETVAELAGRCVAEEYFIWGLTNVNERYFGMTFVRRPGEVAVSIAMPRPAIPLHTFLSTLLDALRGSVRPSLAMLFNLLSKQDAEVMSQGLSGLKDVPPILYLDDWAVVRAGGRDHLRNAPCEVLDMPGGGLLLITRPSLWDEPTAADLERKRAVQQHLGLSEDHPLVFVDPEVS